MSPHVGERIRDVRQARGISLRKLAERVGIHFSHLSKIENGKDTIGRDSLVRIAEELGADPDLMLGEAGHTSMPFRLLGNIAAGVPIEAIEDVETFDLTNTFDPRDHFLLRVRGNSMVDDGIRDGDFAIVRYATEARNGDTVVAIVDGGEATLKRFKQNRTVVILTPANKRMKAMTYGADRIEVRGVLAGVLRTSVK
jgi:repressor LexA